MLRQFFKGGNYEIFGGFDLGNYSKEESIQGRKLFTEIQYSKIIMKCSADIADAFANILNKKLRTDT